MSTGKMEKIENKLIRLKLLINSTTRSQKDFAEQLHCDKSLVTKILTGKSVLTVRLEESIIATFNVNRVWWETGEGEMIQEEKRREPPPTANEHHPQWSGNERVDAATDFLIQWVKEETKGKTPGEIADMIADMREVFRRKKSPDK
jgi:transcriptional regulator with XRE-family HTH domain